MEKEINEEGGRSKLRDSSVTDVGKVWLNVDQPKRERRERKTVLNRDEYAFLWEMGSESLSAEGFNAMIQVSFFIFLQTTFVGFHEPVITEIGHTIFI